MELKSLTYLKQSELKGFRKEYYQKQDGICPILKKKILFEDSVVEHHHAKAGDVIGKNGIGEVRAITSRKGNSFEGLVLKAYKRMGLTNEIELPDLLENLAQYIRKPPLYGKGIIHPSETPKKKLKKLGVRRYNKIKKYWKEIHPKKKIPEFNEKMNLTKDWQINLDKANKIHLKRFDRRQNEYKNRF